MSRSISVVVPAYNAQKTIAVTLRSILSQSSPPAEIIVVDDGSSDGTCEVVATFGSAIRLFKQENQGAAVARQLGTDASKSDYIAYVDADDWWPHDKLQKLQAILQAQHIHFLFADLQRAVPGAEEEDYLPRNTTFYPWLGQYLNQETVTAISPNLYQLDKDRGLSLIMAGFPVYPSTMLVSKAAVDEVGGWDSRFRRCQDFDIALRLARKYPLCFFNDVSAVLGLHAVNSNSNGYNLMQLNGDIAVLEHHIENAGDRQYFDLASAALAGKYCSLGFAYRSVNDLDSAADCYKKATHLPGKKIHAFLRCFSLELFRACRASVLLSGHKRSPTSYPAKEQQLILPQS